MVEESEMNQEVQVEEPAPAAAPVEAPAPAPQPEAPPSYRVTVEGRQEEVTQKEYEYLADMGAQALLAAQYSAHHEQQKEEYSMKTSDDYIEPTQPEPQYDTTAENQVQHLNQRLHALESNLYNHKVDIQTQKIQGSVEDLITESSVFKSMNGLPNGEAMQAEIRREVYNKQLQEKMDIPSAVKAVEEKYSSVLGGDRQKWLMNKVGSVQASSEAPGGSSPNPQSPLTADDWQSGKLLQSITAKLNAAEM
jgi:hypothetical protein